MNCKLLIYGNIGQVSGGYFYDRKLKEYLESGGHRVEIVSQADTSWWHKILQNRNKRVGKELLRGAPDIILEDELNAISIFLVNRKLKKQRNVKKAWNTKKSPPIISIVHHLISDESGFVLRRLLYRIIERTYLRTCDGFICNSQTTAQRVKSLIGRKHILRQDPDFQIAYPAGDTYGRAKSEQWIRSKHERAAPVKILFLGNIIPRKNLECLLKALAEIKGLSWECDVLGKMDIDPRYQNKIMRMRKRLGLGSRVIFRGRIEEKEIRNFLMRSHILAVPSLYEGLGIVFLEAMNWGLVPIAGKSGGVREVIRHGENGFLADPHKPQLLARYIERLIKKPELGQDYAVRAWRNSGKFPGWKTTFERLEKWLKGPTHN